MATRASNATISRPTPPLEPSKPGVLTSILPRSIWQGVRYLVPLATAAFPKHTVDFIGWVISKSTIHALGEPVDSASLANKFTAFAGNHLLSIRVLGVALVAIGAVFTYNAYQKNHLQVLETEQTEAEKAAAYKSKVEKYSPAMDEVLTIDALQGALEKFFTDEGCSCEISTILPEEGTKDLVRSFQITVSTQSSTPIASNASPRRQGPVDNYTLDFTLDQSGEFKAEVRTYPVGKEQNAIGMISELEDLVSSVKAKAEGQ